MQGDSCMVTKVTNDVLADGAVAANNIANGAVTSAAIANNSIDGTKIALGSDAQGDIMYYDGTNWARLPAGTAGQSLQTNGTSANPSWGTPITETASANGYITFPGGIKFEWGTSASINANTTGVVSFPSAFTTEVYSVVVTGTGATNLTTTGMTTVSSANVTSFTIENGDDNARTFYWQAIGK